MSQWIYLPTNGYRVPIQWHAATMDTDTGLLFLPALGTPAERYNDFAKTLSQFGYAVALLEQRGQTHSDLKASRQVDYGFRDFIQTDVPTALAWIREQGLKKVVLGGHSLGGMLSVATAGYSADLIDALVLVASASPYHKNYPIDMALKLRLANTLLPLVLGLYGYFPGYKLGFGDHESRTLMRDWMQLAMHNRFRVRGLNQDLDPQIAQFSKPVLSFRFDQDIMAPEPAITCMQKKLDQAPLTAIMLSETDMGCTANHYGWTQRPQVLCQLTVDWLETLFNDT